MWYQEDRFSVRIGSNTFINVPNLVIAGGETLFSIKRSEQSRSLGIDFTIYDKTGRKVAVVKQGRIYQGNAENYVITSEQDRWSLTDKPSGRTVCEVKKRTLAEGVELDVNVDLYTKSGFHFIATPDGTNIGGLLINNTFRDAARGIMIE